MRILLVDVNMVGGHHEIYMKSIINNTNHSFVVLLNKQCYLSDVKCYTVNFNKHSLRNLMILYNRIVQIVKKEKIDVVHFLEGDYLLRYFGIGLISLRNVKTIITYHHVFEEKAKKWSYILNSKSVTNVVVHSEYIEEKMKSWGITNVRCIDYPHFRNENDNAIYGSGDGDPRICNLLALGGTRFNKGLDILLRALQSVKKNFILTIAGEEKDILREQIEELIQPYRDNVVLKLEYISDEEMIKLINCTDIIILPYRKSFSGASGPMTDGVWYEKMIIGPDNKTIGYTIKKHELGYVFESENLCSLVDTIENAINASVCGFSYSEAAKEYRLRLSEERFDEKYDELYCSHVIDNRKNK